VFDHAIHRWRFNIYKGLKLDKLEFLYKKILRTETLPTDPEVRFTHLLFIFSCVVSAALTVTFAFLYAIMGMPEYSAGQLAIAVTGISCLFIFSRTRNLSLAGNILLAVIFAASVARVHQMGGIKAPTFYTYTFIAVFTTAFLPMRYAAFWTCAFVALALGYHVLDLRGMSPPMALDAKKEADIRIFGIAFANLVSMLVVYFMKRTLIKYQNLLAKEKEDKANLLRIMAHDLASPLTVLGLNANKLRQSVDRAEVGKIIRASEMMNAVIKNVREFEAVNAGKRLFRVGPIEVADLVEQLRFLQDENLLAKKLTLEIEVESEGLAVLGDRDSLLFNVLNNVLSNAIKFSEPGSAIKFVSRLSDDGQVKISIIDQGVGIPKHLLDHLFDFSVKTNRAGTQGEVGTGFGMPIARTCLRAMGGEIRVTSSSGTQVEITLPAASNLPLNTHSQPV
jgi:signal transduction histidine kinase